MTSLIPGSSCELEGQERSEIMIEKTITFYQKSVFLRDIPGGPVVKTLLFQCREHGSIPDQETKISHAIQPIKKNQYSLTFLGSLDLLENLVKILDLFPRKIIHKHLGKFATVCFVILVAKSSLTLCDS